MPAQATTSYVDGPHESGMFKTIRRTPGSMVIAVGRGRVEEVHDIAVATRGRQYYLVKQKSDVLKFGPWTLETVEPRDLVEITMECQIEVRDGVRFYNSGHHSGLEAMAESVMKDRAQRACRNARWNESANVQAQLQSLTDDVAPGAICRVLYVSAKPEKDTNWRYNHLKDREETIAARDDDEFLAHDTAIRQSRTEDLRAKLKAENALNQSDRDHLMARISLQRSAELDAAKDTNRYDRIQVEAGRYGLQGLDPLIIRALSLQSEPSPTDMIALRAALRDERREHVKDIGNLMDSLVNSGLMTDDQFAVMTRMIEAEVSSIAPQASAGLMQPMLPNPTSDPDPFDDLDDHDLDDGLDGLDGLDDSLDDLDDLDD